MSCLATNRALANQQKQKQNADPLRQSFETNKNDRHYHIINNTLIFNQLFCLYLFKINFEYFDIVMYISANKVNVTHSSTPQQGLTSPSTAGHEETSGPKPTLNWPVNAHLSTQRGVGAPSAGGELQTEPYIKFMSLYHAHEILQKEMKSSGLSFSPKASLPPWQKGVCFKS